MERRRFLKAIGAAALTGAVARADASGSGTRQGPESARRTEKAIPERKADVASSIEVVRCGAATTDDVGMPSALLCDDGRRLDVISWTVALVQAARLSFPSSRSDHAEALREPIEIGATARIVGPDGNVASPFDPHPFEIAVPALLVAASGAPRRFWLTEWRPLVRVHEATTVDLVAMIERLD